MPQFLTTSGLNFRIEELLKDAKQEILIISPYVSLLKKTRDRLKSKKLQGVRIEFACRLRDLKEPLEHCSTHVHDVPTLHAKCYLSEKGAVLTSLNLHRFSQQNNDEMGIWIPNSGPDAVLYAEILDEARRLCAEPEPAPAPPLPPPPPPPPPPLVEGQTYSAADINAHFEFDSEAIANRAGIREARSGEVVVFNNSDARNPEVDGLIRYCGQETGGPEQALIFGNAVLNNCWTDRERVIHMFKNRTYAGHFKIVRKPYLDDEGKWRFPMVKAAAADA